MIEAVFSALTQMFSPPFRTVLLKTIALALLLIVIIAIAFQRLLAWLAFAGENWVETVLGANAHTPFVILAWILSVAATLGIIVGSIFLMPAVTALVGSFFVDEIALEVEREYYPSEPVGIALPFSRAMLEGGKAALVAIVVYLVALPSLLIAGLGAVIFFIATAYVLGRVYFELAAMRFHSVTAAKSLRKANQSIVFVAGLFIAAFVSIPIVNLAAPLFAMALMVHIHKQMMHQQRPRIERARQAP
jgi:CysZ protein